MGILNTRHPFLKYLKQKTYSSSKCERTKYLKKKLDDVNIFIRLGLVLGCVKLDPTAQKEGTRRGEREEEDERQIFLMDGPFKIIIFFPFSFVLYGPK